VKKTSPRKAKIQVKNQSPPTSNEMSQESSQAKPESQVYIPPHRMDSPPQSPVATSTTVSTFIKPCILKTTTSTSGTHRKAAPIDAVLPPKMKATHRKATLIDVALPPKMKQNSEVPTELKEVERQQKQKERSLKKWETDLKKKESELNEVTKELAAARILIERNEYENQQNKRQLKLQQDMISKIQEDGKGAQQAPNNLPQAPPFFPPPPFPG
jgi:Skp family chaperone for outer membrane proteins